MSTIGGAIMQAITRAIPADAVADGTGHWAGMMAAAQAGDRVVYEKLLRECIPLIRRLAHRPGVQPGALDAVVQEVLLTVHRARQTYDPARPFVAWLSTIATRRAIDLLRQRGRESRREVHAPVTYEAYSDPDSSPAETCERAGRAKALDEAVAGLSSGQWEAVEHLALRQRSLAEASAVTGRSEGALKVNLHRALKTLQARVKRE
jgi:RNA polymerase sigma-70 factor (ECF subfamily)